MEIQEKRKIKAPADRLTLQLGGSSHEVPMPNIGQIVDMESAKLRMTDGRHAQMVDGDDQALYAYLLVAAIATISVLIPKAVANKSLSNFTPMEAKEIVDLYLNKLRPWLQDIKELANDQVELEKTEQ